MDSLRNSVLRALKWLERYTKTDMVYLAKGGFWLGIGQFVASGAAFLTSVAFANLLSPDTFGIYKYVLSITSILLITSLSGMDSAVTQSISRGFEGTLNIGVKEKIKWSLIGSILSIIISLYYLIQGNNFLAIAFGITTFFIPFLESLDMYNSLLWGKKLFNVQTKYNIIKKLISLFSILIALYFSKNLFILLCVYLLSTVIPNWFFLIKSEKLYLKNNDIDPESIKYGKKLSFINIIGLVLNELDKILVFQYLGATNLVVYSLAMAPNDQIKGLLKNVNSLAMPQFSQRTVGEIKSGILRKVLILGLVTTMIVFMYIFLAPIFFKTFFPRYLDSIIYSQILSLSLIPVVIAGFLSTILESQKATKQLYQYNIYGNVFSIFTLLPLIYYFGIWGAVLSRIINRVFISILSVFLVRKLDDNLNT